MNPPRFKTGAVETVYDALFKDRRISASYRKRGSSGIKEYKELNPLGLVFVDNLIYLIASIGDYLNPVQFLVHRMESVTMLDKNAVVPDGFTLQGYIESGEFSCSLEWLNTDLPINNLVESIKRRPRGTFCFYGAAGTGKSELARYMADQIGKPMILKRASDILSKWVGGSEKNISNMFAEARQMEFCTTV
ncbi:MAG: WYL domain-containing protein [Verrucomicrobia bacterium]|nr:WYL domain-containing protein [Deltaproteobacteria bacterium]